MESLSEFDSEQDETVGDGEEFDEFDIDLACPACGAELIDDALFLAHRVCSTCRRHFWIPARERLDLLLDPGAFTETNQELVSLDPLVFHDGLPVADRLAEAREQTGVADAVVTGTGEIGGESSVFVALDLAVIGSNIGILAGEKIALAMELAISRRLPLIAICSGANGRGFEGVLSLVQLARLASLAGRMHLAGLPLIAIASHPTSGAVQLAFANQADLLFAEPGAHIGYDAAQRTGEPAESLLARGEIDAIVDRGAQRELLTTLLRLFARRGVPRPRPDEPLAEHDTALAWEEVRVVHRVDRPAATDYLHHLAPRFIELHGDRIGADDETIAAGIGRIDGVAVAILCLSRVGAGISAGAYRKASRLIRLAAHLEMPVIGLIDPPPSDDGVPTAATAAALSAFLGHVTQAPVPLVGVALGEIRGAAAFPFAIADRLIMQEHALLTMPQAESAATAKDCLRWGIASAVAREPGAGAHVDLAAAADQLEIAISNALADLAGSSPRRLLDERARRLRTLGMASPETRESLKIEIRELQEWQRLVSRSFDDLRQRWELRPMSLPTFSGKPTMPHLPAKMNLPTISLPKFSFKKPDLAEIAERMSNARRATTRRADPPAEKDAS